MAILPPFGAKINEPVPTGCNLLTGKRCRMANGAMHPAVAAAHISPPNPKAALASTNAEAEGHTVGHVALQFSGHLRALCDSPENWMPMIGVIKRCRELVVTANANARCDVFIHTWDTLHPKTPTWHNRGDNFQLDLTSSAACAARIDEEMKPTRMMVESQSLSTDTDFKSDNGTWFCPEWRKGCNPDDDSGVTYAGLRASTRAVVKAAELRGAFAKDHKIDYLVAVRLRPDIYKRKAQIRISSLSFEAMDIFGQIVSEDFMGVGNGPALTLVGKFPRSLNRTIYGCTGATFPGARNSDHCFWGAPHILDMVLRAWKLTTHNSIIANKCWREAMRPNGPYLQALPPEVGRTEYIQSANCAEIGSAAFPGEDPLRRGCEVFRVRRVSLTMAHAAANVFR